MVDSPFARASQIAALTPAGGSPSSLASSLLALAPFGPPAAKKTLGSEIVALAPESGGPTVRPPGASQIAVVVVFKTGGPDRFDQRAWTFDLDGHTFYVLSLGSRGTWAYDFTTGQWARWSTAGFNNSWNMEGGISWRGGVYAADLLNPLLWRLNPASGIDDDFRPMTRIATGVFTHRERTYLSNYAFRLTASLGEPDDPLTASLSFSWSDDAGKTYAAPTTTTLVPGDYAQDLEFRSLGSIRKPGRVYRIEDTGALVRISGANTDIEGDES